MSSQFKYAFLKGLSGLMCSMSYDRVLSIGRFLGPAIMNRIKKQRERGISQLMGGLSIERDEAEKILQKVYENIGMSVMEMLYMPRLVEAKDRIDDFVTIDHPEYLKEAFAKGHGVVGLTAHIGNWEWLGAGVALYGFPTSAIAKKQADDALMRFINEYREKSGQHIFLTGTGGYEMISAARAMKRNDILGFLSDKDGGENGIPVHFMNRVFSFPQGPAIFAKKFHAPILPIFITRNPGGRGHTIRVGKLFEYETCENSDEELVKNSQRMATVMEDFIRKYPTDWMWFQHLFWTKPEEIEMYVRMRKEKADD